MDTLETYFNIARTIKDQIKNAGDPRLLGKKEAEALVVYKRLLKDFALNRIYEVDYEPIKSLIETYDFMNYVRLKGDRDVSYQDLQSEIVEDAIDFIESFDMSSLLLPAKHLLVIFSNSQLKPLGDVDRRIYEMMLIEESMVMYSLVGIYNTIDL